MMKIYRVKGTLANSMGWFHYHMIATSKDTAIEMSVARFELPLGPSKHKLTIDCQCLGVVTAIEGDSDNV